MKKILFALFPAGVLAALFLWAANSSDGGLFQETSGLLLAFGRLAGILARGETGDLDPRMLEQQPDQFLARIPARAHNGNLEFRHRIF